MTRLFKYVNLIIIYFLYLVNLTGCANNKQSEYITLIQEIYRIECEHITKAGIEVKDVSLYSFKSIAFQEILKNPDRILLQHYEDLNSKLASIMYTLEDENKKELENDMEQVYSKRCN